MKVIAKNVVALIVGILIGGIINMALIIVSPFVIPPPEGVDVTSAESLRSSIHLFEPRHFLFPFLAHALGALAGAIFAALMAATHRSRFALAVAKSVSCVPSLEGKSSSSSPTGIPNNAWATAANSMRK